MLSDLLGNVQDVLADGDHLASMDGHPLARMLLEQLMPHPPVVLLILDEIRMHALPLFLGQVSGQVLGHLHLPTHLRSAILMALIEPF